MKKTGTASTTHLTPKRKKALAARRRREEARWAAKSGPVVIIKPKASD
jgi:hypothetical protein